jgi:hypothetical protein
VPGVTSPDAPPYPSETQACCPTATVTTEVHVDHHEGVLGSRMERPRAQSAGGPAPGIHLQPCRDQQGILRDGRGGNRDGFQAAIYTPVTARGQSLGVKVLAIAGTQGLAMNDIAADLRIGLHVMPKQASTAFKFYQDAVGNEGIAVIVGHSLGGALAQVLGYWCDCPFITFNAPGMASVLAAARFNIFKPDVFRRTRTAKRFQSSDGKARGLNFLVARDLIGKFGKHVGEVIVLRAHPALVRNHANLYPSLWETKVNGQFLSDLDPFMLPPGAV